MLDRKAEKPWWFIFLYVSLYFIEETSLVGIISVLVTGGRCQKWTCRRIGHNNCTSIHPELEAYGYVIKSSEGNTIMNEPPCSFPFY